MELESHIGLHRFDYDFDKERLLSEAQIKDGYEPFIDPLTKKKINDWLIKHVDNKQKAIDYYTKGKVHIKDCDTPYALEITEHFRQLTGFRCKPRFYDQKADFELPYHKDRGTECSINFVLSDEPDPISFFDGEVIYTVGLLNTQVEHAVFATKQRYLFKLSFFDNTFDEVKNVLSSKL